jgi:DNA-binding CsgD family transcriptional regulator
MSELDKDLAAQSVEAVSADARPGAATPPSDPPEQAAPARPVKALTEKQQAVWDLTRSLGEGGQGKTRREAAAILGISEPVVAKYLGVCYRKLGLKPDPVEQAQKRAVESRDPVTAVAAIAAASDPWERKRTAAIDRVNEMLKAEGMPAKVSAALVRRLQVKYAGTVYAARELRTNEILEMMGKKIDLCAFYLDDKVLAEASARDIMLGMTALVEKRQLLRGEPTAIVSDAERAKLHELLPRVIAEARRRGLTLEGEVTGKTLEPSA